MKKFLISASTLVSGLALAGAQLIAPVVPTTQGVGSGGSMAVQARNLVLGFKDLATGLYSTIFIVAFLVFFGVIIFKFLIKGGDAAARKEGMQYLGFGILALFVMFGIMGIIAWISGNTGVGVGGDIPVPGVPVNVRTY